MTGEYIKNMDENRFSLTGVVTKIDETKQLSQYLRKKNFKIRFSDIDFTGKMQERIIKLDTINAGIAILDNVIVGDLVKIMFYIEGRDYYKDDNVINFTSLIAYELEILTSESRDTQEDKEAVHTNLGRVYKLKDASEEELARNMVSIDDNDPLVTTDKADDPFSNPEEVKDYDDLPF